MPHDYAAAFAVYPSLREWLRRNEWRKYFGSTALDRSAAYANEGKVIEIDAEELDYEEVATYALVLGSASEPYETGVVFKKQRSSKWQMNAMCSCPVGENCKHAAALLTVLAGADLTAQPAAPASVPAVAGNWLRTLTTAVATPPSTPPAPAPTKFLIYCIEKEFHGFHDDAPETYHFVFRTATLRKNGTMNVSRSEAYPTSNLDANYLTEQDIECVSRYWALNAKKGKWGHADFKEPGWDRVLDHALQRGRLFFANSHLPSDKSHIALKAGPEVRQTPAWEALPDGSVHPVLETSQAGVIILPFTPPLYIDPVQGLLGPVVSDLPAQVTTAWANGPTIRAADLPAFAAALQHAPLAAGLPTPPSIDSQTLTGLTPRPHLHITRQEIGIFRKSCIIGKVSFHYEGCPPQSPMPAGAQPFASWMQNSQRVVLTRDVIAENRFYTVLFEADLEPLSASFASSDLTDATRFAVRPIDSFPHEIPAWIGFIESRACEAMKAAGWTIEIDPGLGLDVHNVSDFFPEIAGDPDHGIDWFRFDVTCEVNGKKISLIPQIAQAIRHGMLDALPYDPAFEADAEDEEEYEFDDPAPFDGDDYDDDWDDEEDEEEHHMEARGHLPQFFLIPCDPPSDGVIRFPSDRFMEICRNVAHLFHGRSGDGPLRVDRLAAAGVADALAIDGSETTRALAALGNNLRNIHELPAAALPATVQASLRPYQLDGFRWLQFLARHGLNGILADDMGLGKTLQTLSHLAAECARQPGRPSLVIAPTSVVPNWADEAGKFIPGLRVLTLHGAERSQQFEQIADADIVLTSYPLLTRDIDVLTKHDWHSVVLDEAQYIKNAKAAVAQNACQLKAAHRICLSGTPMENHLGELWSLMRFLMPGFLADEKTFNSTIRRPIERDRSSEAQTALNRRVAPLILRRTKDEVAKELPEKTELLHHIDLHKKQSDLYESVRAAMDKRVRDAIASKGLAKSHIIVLDALLKLRQICCHPQLLNTPAAKKVKESAKLDYLTGELLPQLFEEGRRILLFSQFTSMLAMIEEHLAKEKIPFLKLTGQTKNRAALVKQFQTGEIPIFLISLKAGGTGLNLTAADTVIHYDPWWNPAAENQATDRAHRIGQTKPVFVHKLVCRGTIEDRILELQKHKSALVEALLSEETSKLKIDADTLSHLLAPLD